MMDWDPPQTEIEMAFRRGMTIAEMDESGGTTTECPEVDPELRHWWTRGYAYTARGLAWKQEEIEHQETRRLLRKCHRYAEAVVANNVRLRADLARHKGRTP